MDKKGYHIKVTGMVQGVGYRYYCRETANSLGLNGFVMNMPDGSVEMEVFGDVDSIGEFTTEMSRRDRSYVVREMQKNEIPVDDSYRDFHIMQYPGY